MELVDAAPDADVLQLDDDAAVSEPTQVRHLAPGSTPLVRLIRAGNSQRLEHVVTGEMVTLVAPPGRGNAWAIREQDGWGYLEAAETPPVWVNDILRSTLWRVPHGLYIQTSQENGDEPLTTWLDDLNREMLRQYASWPGTSNYQQMPRLSIVQYLTARDGATVFLSVRDVQDALGLSCKYGGTTWRSKNRGAWEHLLQALGIPTSHLVIPSSGVTASSLAVDSTFVSAYAVALILCNGAENMKSADDRLQCARMLRGICENMLTDTTFFVQPGCNSTPERRLSAGEEVAIVDHVLRLPGATGIPELSAVNGAHLWDALRVAFAKRSRSVWFLSSLVVGFGASLELAAKDYQWPTNPLQCLSRAGRRRRCDNLVRQAVMDLPKNVVRNAYRATTLLRQLGFGVAAHRAWVDAHFMRRYFWSFRSTVRGGVSWSYACDKSRGAGRDWLSGNLGTVESGTFGWCQPVATRSVDRFALLEGIPSQQNRNAHPGNLTRDPTHALPHENLALPVSPIG